jgi:hypothetical protein
MNPATLGPNAMLYPNSTQSTLTTPIGTMFCCIMVSALRLRTMPA